MGKEEDTCWANVEQVNDKISVDIQRECKFINELVQKCRPDDLKSGWATVTMTMAKVIQ